MILRVYITDHYNLGNVEGCKFKISIESPSDPTDFKSRPGSAVKPDRVVEYDIIDHFHWVISHASGSRPSFSVCHLSFCLYVICLSVCLSSVTLS